MKFLMVSGGEVSDYNFLKNEIDKFVPDYIVAIDKGANHLNNIGVDADILIGDLDSIDVNLKEKYKDKILKLPVEKDDTDTAVALDYAMSNGAKEVKIYASVGSRFDHTYANVLLLKRALDNNIKCTLINEQNKISLHNKSFSIKEMVGSTASFFAFDKPVTITLNGFYYPLDKYLMKKYDPLGVSNKVISNNAEVIFEEGELLSIIASDK
ncbi:thiamine diphosphokinase [Anaerofustis butyriciformans]|uniref:thiamine diphosphokinase n=1 Tax=Anaerofustis TaxID=264995 RepID=UPI003F8A9947